MPVLTYAIGDIHGQLDLLRSVHVWIAEDAAGRPHQVIHIGDYTDRGPDSAGVIDFLTQGIDAGAPWRCLKGNHDRMFAVFVADATARDPILRADYSWLHPALGGLTTLASYGVAEADPQVMWNALHDVIPDRHIAFLNALPLSFETDTHFFCHAGIQPGVPLAAQTEDDLIWIRAPFHMAPQKHPKVIVHGHTPVDRSTDYGNRINIDSGAAFGGALSVIVLEAGRVWQLGPSGRFNLPFEPAGSV